MIFYDTCALVKKVDELIKSDKIFAFADLTLKELENIKTSRDKDERTKFQVRKLLHFLYKHPEQYEIVETTNTIYDYLPINNDGRIISTMIDYFNYNRFTE